FLKSLWDGSQGWEREERVLALLTITALPFWFRALVLGTFSIWEMLFLWKFYRALREKREVAAGLWLAMGSIHPTVTLFPLLALIGSRRWRALGAWAAGMGLFGLSSAWIIGLPAWTGFLWILWLTGSTSSHPGIVPEHMYNLRGTLLSILGRSSWELVQAISWGSFALGALATLALWGQKPRSEVELDLRWGITVAVGLFLSPHLNPQDGLLMGLPALWLYGAVRDGPRCRRWLGAMMVLSPLFFLLGEAILGGRLGIRIPTAGILALGGWSLKAWRSTRAIAQLS
ncbi:MAG: glycosyltransferase family 87 protein, partial [Thermoflexus sp.]